jgi:hypothetical protein
LAGKPDVEAAATKPQEDGLGGGLLSSFLGNEGVEESAGLLPVGRSLRAQAGVLPEEVHEPLPIPISYIGDRVIRRNIPPSRSGGEGSTPAAV